MSPFHPFSMQVKKKEKVIEYNEEGEKKHISNTYLDYNLKYDLERFEKDYWIWKWNYFLDSTIYWPKLKRQKLDNKITSEIYALDLELEEKQESEYNQVKENFTAIKDEYTRRAK